MKTSPEDIAELLIQIDKKLPNGRNINRGGNLGLALVAVAISELAQAVDRLASANVQQTWSSDPVCTISPPADCIGDKYIE